MPYIHVLLHVRLLLKMTTVSVNTLCMLMICLASAASILRRFIQTDLFALGDASSLVMQLAKHTHQSIKE
jgi:hypothetical protein